MSMKKFERMLLGRNVSMFQATFAGMIPGMIPGRNAEMNPRRYVTMSPEECRMYKVLPAKMFPEKYVHPYPLSTAKMCRGRNDLLK